MLVAKEFVFVHVPKTGGTFLGTCMRASAPVLDLGMHGYYRHLPDEYKHLPAICFSRNPWDWYVSLWHQRQRQGHQETLLELLETCFAKTPDHYSRLFRRIA